MRGFHLGWCEPNGDAPAGPGCTDNCPRRLHAEVARLREEIRTHRACCLGPDGLGGDFDDWEQAGRRLWAALDREDDDEHPEATCDRCGRPNPVWYAPPKLWRRVEIDRGFNGVLCPTCFIDDAEQQGVTAPPGTPGWLVVNDARAALDGNR